MIRGERSHVILLRRVNDRNDEPENDAKMVNPSPIKTSWGPSVYVCEGRWRWGCISGSSGAIPLFCARWRFCRQESVGVELPFRWWFIDDVDFAQNSAQIAQKTLPKVPHSALPLSLTRLNQTLNLNAPKI